MAGLQSSHHLRLGATLHGLRQAGRLVSSKPCLALASRLGFSPGFGSGATTVLCLTAGSTRTLPLLCSAPLIFLESSSPGVAPLRRAPVNPFSLGATMLRLNLAFIRKITVLLPIFLTNLTATAQSSPSPVEIVIPKLVNHAPLPPIKGSKREITINFTIGENNKIKSITKISGNQEIISMIKPYLMQWKFSAQGPSRIKFVVKYYTICESNQTKQPTDIFIYPDTMILHYSLPIHYD